MTCARYENDLALHVERDLPPADVPAIEAHLRECAECRRFLDDLRASQSLVRGLAAQPIGDEALTDLRERVIAAASVPARDQQVSPMVWAAAAVVVVGALVWMAKGRQELRAPSVVEGPATTVPSRPQRLTMHRSTPSTMPSVSPDVDRARVARAQVSRPARVPSMSAADADQLALAVVAVSRIRSAHDRPPEPDPSPATESAPLMRLATADPTVVIYWQLEPNGGE